MATKRPLPVDDETAQANDPKRYQFDPRFIALHKAIAQQRDLKDASSPQLPLDNAGDQVSGEPDRPSPTAGLDPSDDGPDDDGSNCDDTSSSGTDDTESTYNSNQEEYHREERLECMAATISERSYEGDSDIDDDGERVPMYEGPSEDEDEDEGETVDEDTDQDPSEIDEIAEEDSGDGDAGDDQGDIVTLPVPRKPQITRLEGRAIGLADRLKSFLPVIEKANQGLGEEREGVGEVHDDDKDEEGDEEGEEGGVEMHLALGVLEEKKKEENGLKEAVSYGDAGEGQGDEGAHDRGPGAEQEDSVLDRLLGRQQATGGEEPGIQEMLTL